MSQQPSKLVLSTNLMCQGCVKRVQTQLDQHPLIQAWQVDTQAPHKPLSLYLQSPNQTDPNIFIELLQSLGFEAQVHQSQTD